MTLHLFIALVQFSLPEWHSWGPYPVVPHAMFHLVFQSL